MALQVVHRHPDRHFTAEWACGVKGGQLNLKALAVQLTEEVDQRRLGSPAPQPKGHCQEPGENQVGQEAEQDVK